MNPSDQPTAEQAALEVQLGDQKGENAKLRAALEAIAERANSDSSGGWKAAEWLGLILHGSVWLPSKAWKGLTFVAERLSSYNERQAKAEKTRKEGEALLVKAKAEATLISAKARIERAKAEEQEIKNETAEELLRRIKERGIDIRAEVRDGQLQVAVVKEETGTRSSANDECGEKPKKTQRRKKTTEPRGQF